MQSGVSGPVSPWHVALSATKELSGGIFCMIGTKVMPGRSCNLLTLFRELHSQDRLSQFPNTLFSKIADWKVP